MKLRITASGIYGANGEYPIGHEFETDAAIPDGWAGKVLVVEEAPKPAAKAVVNPKAE
jgi:hypothetical protein